MAESTTPGCHPRTRYKVVVEIEADVHEATTEDISSAVQTAIWKGMPYGRVSVDEVDVIPLEQ